MIWCLQAWREIFHVWVSLTVAEKHPWSYNVHKTKQYFFVLQVFWNLWKPRKSASHTLQLKCRVCDSCTWRNLSTKTKQKSQEEKGSLELSPLFNNYHSCDQMQTQLSGIKITDFSGFKHCWKHLGISNFTAHKKIPKMYFWKWNTFHTVIK